MKIGVAFVIPSVRHAIRFDILARLILNSIYNHVIDIKPIKFRE